MSPFAKRIAIFSIVAAAAVIAARFALRNEPAKESELPKDPAGIEYADADVPTVRPRINAPARHIAARSNIRDEVTTGVRTLPMVTPAALPPLTGYALDHFDNWTTIPGDYAADGIAIVNGAVSLAYEPGSTGSRTGILVSPPLPLKQPSMSAPADSPVTPDNTDIILEISLSEDGSAWSPWAVAQRYTPPDGKRVRPPLQARLSPADIAAHDDRQTTTLPPGPALRYRLTLSATGPATPAVTDVRIWKQEYQ